MAKQIVVIGSVNADLVVEVDRLPSRGETIAASKTDTGRFYPGGKGANQAAAVARLASGSGDIACFFVGQFGNDAHGVELQSALRRLDVDLSLSGQAACPSGQAFVFVYPDGDNSIIIVGGANATWPVTLPQNVVEAIQGAAIVMLQCEIPMEVNQEVVRIAAAANVPVMWDCGGQDRSIPQELLSLLTYVCPNETELERLVGVQVKTVEQAVDSARALQRTGAQNVLVTLGSLGSLFVGHDEAVIHQPCIAVDHVVDTTGAGDCFRGAFAVACAGLKLSVKESLAFAAAASALCVQVPGAMPSMPSFEATSALLQSRSFTQ